MSRSTVNRLSFDLSKREEKASDERSRLVLTRKYVYLIMISPSYTYTYTHTT